MFSENILIFAVLIAREEMAEHNVDAAMAQIEQKDYAKVFADDARKIIKVALNFSEDQRSIEDWKVK